MSFTNLFLVIVLARKKCLFMIWLSNYSLRLKCLQACQWDMNVSTYMSRGCTDVYTHNPLENIDISASHQQGLEKWVGFSHKGLLTFLSWKLPGFRKPHYFFRGLCVSMVVLQNGEQLKASRWAASFHWLIWVSRLNKLSNSETFFNARNTVCV